MIGVIFKFIIIAEIQPFKLSLSVNVETSG